MKIMKPILPHVSIFGVGVVVGACLASYALQCNYRGIVDQFHNIDSQTKIQQVQHQILMEWEQLKQDYISDDDYDQVDVDIATTTTTKPTNACLSNHHHTLQKHCIDEITTTYRTATEALQKASHRVQVEIDKQELFQLQLSQCEKRKEAIRNTLTDSHRSLDVLSGDVQSLTNQVQQLEKELNLAWEELDRRDEERVECDAYYRDLVECRGGMERGGGE